MITRPGAELILPQRPLGTAEGDRSVWEVGAHGSYRMCVH